MNFRTIKAVYVQDRMRRLEKNYEYGVITPDEFYKSRSDLAETCRTFEQKRGVDNFPISDEKDEKNFHDFLRLLHVATSNSDTFFEDDKELLQDMCKRQAVVIVLGILNDDIIQKIALDVLFAEGIIISGCMPDERK